MMHYYLIINEGVENGLIRSQVLAPIEYNSLQADVGIISIERLGRRTKMPPGVVGKILPLGFPYRLFLFNSLGFILIPLLAWLYAFVLCFITKKDDVLIARSYFPAIVLYNLKRIRGNCYKFDPRSLFIHESVTKGLFKPDSLLYRYWLSLEKKIVENAEATFVVAKKQGEYYKAISGTALEILNIPCYSSAVTLDAASKAEILPFSDQDLVLAYYGSLDDGWNNKTVYSNIFRSAISLGYKICIISQNYEDLKKDSKFLNDNIFLVDTKLSTDFSKYLQACDYGIVVMPKTPDWETRLSVKFAEYLTQGLAVVVGEYVGEAARISSECFSEFNKIIKGETFEGSLKKLTYDQKLEISRRASVIFGMENFKKILVPNANC